MEHHAYYAEGSSNNLNAFAVAAARLLQIKIQANPDVTVRHYPSLGIDDARELKRFAELSPLLGKKLFVLAVDAMTSDAQNALLKLFEEPAPHTHFFLLAPHGMLLPTLKSRCLRFDFEQAGDTEERKQAETFLRSAYGVRSTLVEKLLKDKEREQVRSFLNALETVLYESKISHKAEGLADIALMRRYVGDRAPSLKMILEHLATTLPRTS